MLMVFFAASAWGSARLVVKNEKFFPFDQVSFEKQFTEAAKLFEEEVGELDTDITVNISPSSCLRTGYDRVSGEVVFCPTTKVINAGLNSVDVINHELFHAFLCHFDREICNLQEKDYLHEALADVFAYKLNPDDLFGEDYYKEFLYIRKYRVDSRPGLVVGDHEKGNAFAGQFIKNNTSFKRIIEMFHEEEPKEEMSDIVTGAPKSKLNRYRLSPDQVMQIEFEFAPEADVLYVEWTVPEGVKVTKHGDKKFSIEISSEPESSKGFAIFYSSEGKELGRRAYYFGLKKN
jgi:hypothetical protein